MARSQRPPEEIAKSLRQLARRRIKIGIPAANDPRAGDPIGNVSLGYIHEHGSPSRNIPARPFLRPGVAEAMPEIIDKLRQAAQAALAGDSGGIDAALAEVGVLGVRSVQRRIQAGIPPPLKPATVRGRRVRTPGSRYRRQATTPADVTPLIDTGALIRSITYIVE